MDCPFCHETVKLNEIIRSAYHVVGCVRCYGRPNVVDALATVATVKATSAPIRMGRVT